jgi:hypothetical protein
MLLLLLALFAGVAKAEARDTRAHCEVIRFSLVEPFGAEWLFNENVVFPEGASEIELFRDSQGIYKADIGQHDTNFGTGLSMVLVFINHPLTGRPMATSNSTWPEQGKGEALVGLTDAYVELVSADGKSSTRVVCGGRLK